MIGLTHEQAIALPKGHPLRFITLYGGSRLIPTAARNRWQREAEYLAWRFKHPFAADLLECVETNS